MAINIVMVIGASQMGGGIAQVMAQTGHKTYMNDVNIDIVNSRLAFIEKLLTKDVAKGKITEEQKAATLANLIPSTDVKDAADCDLVVEAIVENMDIKAKVFKQLDEICKPSCILASNTSSLPITEIAAATKRPEQVIGMQFMKLGMNHPMGPLQLADFIGLDTVLAIMNVMYEGYGDCKYRPCPLLRQYVKAGWLGKKSGRGFYKYD